MGRRGTDAAGHVETASGAWDAVRHVLGRLFAHAEVREVPAGRMTLPVRVWSLPAAPAPGSGALENNWQPGVTVSETAIPQVLVGEREQSLLPSVRLAGESHALTPPECLTFVALGRDNCRVAEAELDCSVETVGLPPSFLALPSSPVVVSRSALPTVPPAERQEGWRLSGPNGGALRVPRLPVPRVCLGGDDVLIRMDLTRRCRETPPNMTPNQAFPAERHRLAKAAALPPEEVTLLGVYPGVPILAVSRLIVEEEGLRLRLWLKPAALRAKGGGRVITLLVGRRVADGKMLQAAL